MPDKRGKNLKYNSIDKKFINDKSKLISLGLSQDTPRLVSQDTTKNKEIKTTILVIYQRKSYTKSEC